MPGTGIIYYRIKQTDFDGNFTYSGALSINCSNTDNSEVFDVDMYEDGATIFFTGKTGSRFTLQIINSTGQIITNMSEIITDGLNRVFIPLNAASGIYFVSFTDESRHTYKKVFF